MAGLVPAISIQLEWRLATGSEQMRCCQLILFFIAFSFPAQATLVMGPTGALAFTRHLVVPLPYDIQHDFQPIALVARGQLLLAVSPATPFHSVLELIAYPKPNPGNALTHS